MSTWHQQQAPVQLWHRTMWTLVFDGPNKLTSVERFLDAAQAQHAADRHNLAGQHCYILPPQHEKT